jgi:TonB family protein
MRRARLKDFITTYPESRYMRAVQAQLDAINAHETAEWINVTNTAFAPKIKRDDKLAALKAYEMRWGGALLGGRDSEIKALREEILETKGIEPLPSRKLKNLKSPIPETVPDKLLAGGPRPVISPPVIVAPPVIKPIIPKVVELDIVQPRARRERTPIYPRKAFRKNVKAIVTLSLNINEKGRVKMIDVLSVEAERYEKDFVKAAKRAARRTSYYPKTVDGQPRAASGVVKRYKFDPDA